VLAIGMIATAIAGPANMLMIARHQLKALLSIRLLGVAIFFAAMMVLVPSHGFIGLAWSVLLLKVVSCIATLTYLRRYGNTVPLWLLLRAPSAACAGMLAFFMLSKSLPFVVHAMLTAVVGTMLLVAFKGVGKQDLHYLRRILRPAT
jgi:O-antigen/teichoic acid export membrane protein